MTQYSSTVECDGEMQRLAFEIKGDAIKRVAPQYRIHGDTPQTWWLDDGAEISMTPLANGLRLELTPDLLDGCERSVLRFATFISEFHDMCAADVGRLYRALAGMMVPLD